VPDGAREADGDDALTFEHAGPRAIARRARAPRRAVVALLYAALVAVMLRALAGTVPGVEDALDRLGGLAPAPVVELAGGPALLALAGLALLALVLAAGAFVAGRGPAPFAVLAAGTLAWLALPYAEVPWAGLLADGPPPEPIAAPLEVWAASLGLVALATVETLATARGDLLDTLARRGLPAEENGPVDRATRRARTRTAAGALAVGSALAAGYAAARGDLPSGGLDLVWGPVVLGALLAAALWLAAREP
jgi:hypothetical protein